MRVDGRRRRVRGKAGQLCEIIFLHVGIQVHVSGQGLVGVVSLDRNMREGGQLSEIIFLHHVCVLVRAFYKAFVNVVSISRVFMILLVV